MLNSLEEYTRLFAAFHPQITRVLQPVFNRWCEQNQWRHIDLDEVRVELKPSTWWAFRASGRGHKTPMWVWFSKIFIAEGFINEPADVTRREWMNDADLTTRYGWQGIAHELFHVLQRRQYGWWGMLSRYWSAIWGSRRRSQMWWDHRVIQFEQEAIAFGAYAMKNVEFDSGLFLDIRKGTNPNFV
jgi:hypothetical protein